MILFATNRRRRAMVAAGLSLLVASTALAQQQEFRDPTTGQVWTPNNVGTSNTPTLPQDRAFNPQGQTAAVRGVTAQAPAVNVLGSVPITAGPTVPVAVIDNATLSAIPTQRWQVVLYLDNNSAGTINPVIDCTFANSGNPVENVRASLPPVAGGQRVGLTIYGPQTSLFVDRADCRLASW